MTDQTLAAPAPPVDFDATSQEFLRDPESVLGRLREECPVFYSPKGGFWGITRYDDIMGALHDFKTFSQGVLAMATVPEEYRARIPQNFFKTAFTALDPPEHTPYRKAGQRALTRGRIKYLEQPIRELASDLIDTFIDDESCDLMNQYCYLITISAIMLMLGLPMSERERLRRFAYEFAVIIQEQVIDLPPEEHARLWEFHAETRAWFREVIEERRRAPGADMISQMLAMTDASGTPMFDEERIATHINEFLFGGTDTAANTMGSAVVHLDGNTDLREEVRRNPELMTNVFEEALRMGGPVLGIWKKTTRDVEIGGVTIPKDAAVWLLLFSAGRAGDRFASPETFDPHRPNVDDHVTFGLGRHFCLGAPLARMEGQIGLQTLYERIPDLRVVPGTTLEYQETTIVRYLQRLPVVWGSKAAALGV
jgi:cytochrome P450